MGEVAPLAHQNVREFPDWYKPYTFNYHSEGYFLLAIFGFCICKCVFPNFEVGYSYLNDIKEQKGRRKRKIFNDNDYATEK